MNILIKFPSRGRPDKFRLALEAYLNKQSNIHNLHFICSFDEDDSLMNNNEMRQYLSQYSNIDYIYGYSNNKIEAINRDIHAHTDFDILILAADDLYPIVDGYDNIIAQDMAKYFPDLDGTLHYMNPSWEERLDIGCIMSKTYYNRFNFIYNPTYKSIYCDNEYMEVAKILGKHQYIPHQLFAHHYVLSDPTANRNWVFNTEDERNFNNRKAQNFYLT